MCDCIEHKQKGNRGGYGNGYWEGQQIMLHRLAYCQSRGVSTESILDSSQ